MSEKKRAIVTGASGGIGAGLVDGFLKQGYNVAATSLRFSPSMSASPSLFLVEGDIGKQETAVKVVEGAIQHFGSVDVLVNNAGIFYVKPFTDFTTEDVNALVSTNLLGFIYITQLSVKQMLRQKSGNVVTITAALADNPIAGVNASVWMITKGGLNTVTRSLAIEYAKEGIRFNRGAAEAVQTASMGSVVAPITTSLPFGPLFPADKFRSTISKSAPGLETCARKPLKFSVSSESAAVPAAQP